MSQQTNVSNLAIRVSTECKAIRTLVNGNMADLSSLSTTAKNTLIAAVNELKSAIDAVPSAAAIIVDGSTGTATTWSSTKISGEITTAINAVLDGAPAALDTLAEFAAAIGNDANFAASITTALGNRVRVDTAAQGLTTEQQGNARTNIGAASAADVGDTTVNFVTTFEAGLV